MTMDEVRRINRESGGEFPVDGPTAMSLRDWFAGQALVGLSIQDGMAASEYIAGESYKIADAMIAERGKK